MRGERLEVRGRGYENSVAMTTLFFLGRLVELVRLVRLVRLVKLVNLVLDYFTSAPVAL